VTVISGSQGRAIQVALYSKLTEEVLRRKRSKQYDAESLLLSAKLLEQNPEVYTIWNYRREALEEILDVRPR
jgi:geranylgeranyl transferase type-2 subunit alpha